MLFGHFLFSAFRSENLDPPCEYNNCMGFYNKLVGSSIHQYNIRLFWMVTIDVINSITNNNPNYFFRPLKDVPRWCDTQLEVSENYSNLSNWIPLFFSKCTIMRRFSNWNYVFSDDDKKVKLDTMVALRA